VVTLIQRFGSALNLNVHFHMLWLDGVYEKTTEPPQRKPRLRCVRAPSSAQLTHLAGYAHRVCRHLVRRGCLEGEDGSVFLSDSVAGDDGMDGLRMNAITYCIATCPHVGRKVVTLQTLPGNASPLEGEAGMVGGFSLHAGVAAEAYEREKLEKRCRSIARPAISEQRLSISPQGRVRYELKTPWRNGTTDVEWHAVDFIAKRAALVPPPRAHLTRFHGIFALNVALRAALTPSGRGNRSASDAAPVDVSANDEPRSPEQKRRAKTWAQRLKRVLPSTSLPACTAAARYGSSPASRNPAHFTPSWPTSRNTARGSKRTNDPQRARRRRPLDEAPATQPVAKPESDLMRPRPRRAALGPVPGFGEKWLRTEPLRGPAMSKTEVRTSDPRPNRRLHDRPLPARLAEKGV